MPEGGRPRQIASLDWLGDTGQLRAEAEEALRHAGDSTPSGERLEGTDESGAVSVTVDARGQAVKVEVSREWRDHLAVGRFAAALFEAYTSAVKASFEGAALAALASEQDAERRTPASSAPAVDPGLDGSDWLRAVWAVLDANEVASRRLSAMDSADRRQRTLTSPRGYFTLHLYGQGLERITGDVRRIALADAVQLGQDALAALQAVAPHHDRSNDSGSANAT